MKTNIIFFTILSILFFTGCSSYKASYEQTPLIIDGLSSDWTTTLDSKNNNSFSYGISNDNKNLYIRININDLSIQKKIMLAGLTVWVDTTGKKKETLGITCPIKRALPNMDRNKMKQMHNAPEWKQDQLLEVEFLGFKEYIENYFISQNPYGVQVSIKQDKFKSLYYEMKIPFKSIYSNYSNISLKTLSIGLETGALKIPTTSKGTPGMSSRPGGMSGGGGRGGSSGGHAGGGKGGRPSRGTPNSSLTDMTSPTKIWIKNILLANP